MSRQGRDTTKIEFYSKWMEIIIDQTLNPDSMKDFRNISDGQFLAPACPGWAFHCKKAVKLICYEK
jgi:hypothetical protein